MAQLFSLRSSCFVWWYVPAHFFTTKRKHNTNYRFKKPFRKWPIWPNKYINRFFFSLIILVINLLNLCLKKKKIVADQNLPPFTYTGHKDGPREWGHLCRAYAKCGSGVRQSPVNIEKGKAVLTKKLKPLTRYYKPANATLINNGFNVGVHIFSKLCIVLYIRTHMQYFCSCLILFSSIVWYNMIMMLHDFLFLMVSGII